MENKFLKVKAVQDDSGHWYLIPNKLCDEFHLDESNEEFCDSGGFSEKWGQYATGGDLNLVQLWVKNPEALEESKPETCVVDRFGRCYIIPEELKEEFEKDVRDDMFFYEGHFYGKYKKYITEFKWNPC